MAKSVGRGQQRRISEKFLQDIQGRRAGEQDSKDRKDVTSRTSRTSLFVFLLFDLELPEVFLDDFGSVHMCSV